MDDEMDDEYDFIIFEEETCSETATTQASTSRAATSQASTSRAATSRALKTATVTTATSQVASLPTGGKKRRRNALSHAQKVALISAIKERPRIWDLADKLHSDTTAVNASWREIAKALNKTVEECKLAWGSLRDSRRYYASLSKKKKSGDDGGHEPPTQLVADCGEWKYSELLSFLPNVGNKRRTFKSVNFGPSQPDIESSCSNYSYLSTTPSKNEEPKSPAEEDADERLISSIQQLVDHRVKKTDAHSATVNYIKQLLQMLPEDKATKMSFEFIQKLQNEIQNNN